MLNIDDNGLFEVFPMIQTISDSFEYQNSMLNKIVLTGKINALEIAENLFDFTQKTAETFTSLQEKLISNMLEENKKEMSIKSSIKANIVLDLVENSFKNKIRESVFLSENEYIQNYLLNSNKDISQIINFYQKQNKYLDVILLDTNGNVKYHLNKDNRIKASKDYTLSEAAKIDDVILKYDSTDLYLKNKKSLFSIKKITKDDKHLGYITIIYDIQKELDLIFNSFTNSKNKDYIVIRYQKDILLSSEKGLDNKFIQKINKNNECFVTNNRCFYKVVSNDKFGIEVIVSYPAQEDINIIAEFNNKQVNNRELIEIGINNPELKKLANEGYEILEDLSDVIINGELIAAKSKQYVLIPILDNLREVSFRVIKLIEFSISNLQKIIHQSLINSTTLFAKSINELLSRYIYECSVDIRLWALEKDFSDLSDTSRLNNKLKYLNELSPMYSDIFIYDENSKIVAISNSQHFIGETIEKNFTSRNTDSNNFFMSEFVPSKFYGNKPTYIFYATLIKDSKVIGGIGAVMDGEVQCQKVLDNIFKDTENVIGLIITKTKKIIASNNEDFKLYSEFSIIDELEEVSKEIMIHDKKYQLALSKSEGYKDYHNEELYSIVMMEK